MNPCVRFWRSTIGAKIVMAVTGIVLSLFLVGHLAGNLLVYVGPEAMNAYALKLAESPALTWPARIVLLLMLALHVLAALRLTALNRRARPTPYAVKKPINATLGSRTMMLTGLLVLAFVVYHLLHFTFGTIQPANHALRTAEGHHDVHRMMIEGFKNPLVTASYVVAMLVLALHLSHGVSSLLQSLGFSNPRFRGFRERLGPAVAAILAAGFISIPIAVLLGVVKSTEGVL